jgi:AcrR family transcriptional regulator
MLDAAARLFGSQRFHEVRMEDIAAEAAVGKGTLYRYFNDKEELYLALLERASQQLVERLREQLEDLREPRRKLEAIVSGIISFFDDQPHLLDLIQRAEVLSGPNLSWQKARDEVFQFTRDVLEEGARRGLFVVRDSELAVTMLLAGLRGIVRFYKQRPDDLAERIVDGMLHGYAGCGHTI